MKQFGKHVHAILLVSVVDLRLICEVRTTIHTFVVFEVSGAHGASVLYARLVPYGLNEALGCLAHAVLLVRVAPLGLVRAVIRLSWCTYTVQSISSISRNLVKVCKILESYIQAKELNSFKTLFFDEVRKAVK